MPPIQYKYELVRPYNNHQLTNGNGTLMVSQNFAKRARRRDAANHSPNQSLVRTALSNQAFCIKPEIYSMYSKSKGKRDGERCRNTNAKFTIRTQPLDERRRRRRQLRSRRRWWPRPRRRRRPRPRRSRQQNGTALTDGTLRSQISRVLRVWRNLNYVPRGKKNYAGGKENYAGGT